MFPVVLTHTPETMAALATPPLRGYNTHKGQPLPLPFEGWHTPANALGTSFEQRLEDGALRPVCDVGRTWHAFDP